MYGCNLGEDQVGVQGHSSLYIRFQARLCYRRPCIKRGGEQNQISPTVFSCHLITNLTSEVCTRPLITEGQCCVNNILGWQSQPCLGFQ